MHGMMTQFPLTRAAIRGTIAGVYEIGPLDWRSSRDGTMHNAEVLGFPYRVRFDAHDRVVDGKWLGMWYWRAASVREHECDSLEAGKAACEADWRGRIAACLVPVEWRPIETAPKDGRGVLVWCPERKSTYAAIWDESLGEWSPFGSRDTYTSRPVTHWQPLPAPPTGERG